MKLFEMINEPVFNEKPAYNHALVQLIIRFDQNVYYVYRYRGWLRNPKL